MKTKHMTSIFALSLLLIPDSVFAGKGDVVDYPAYTMWENVFGASAPRKEAVEAGVEHRYATQRAEALRQAREEVEQKHQAISAKLAALKSEEISGEAEPEYTAIQARAEEARQEARKQYTLKEQAANRAYEAAVERLGAEYGAAMAAASKAYQSALEATATPTSETSTDLTASIMVDPVVEARTKAIAELKQQERRDGANDDKRLAEHEAESIKIRETVLADAAKTHRLAIAAAERDAAIRFVDKKEEVDIAAFLRSLESSEKMQAQERARHDAQVAHYEEKMRTALEKLQALQSAGADAAEHDEAAGEDSGMVVAAAGASADPSPQEDFSFMGYTSKSGFWWARGAKAKAARSLLMAEYVAPVFTIDGSQVATWLSQGHELHTMSDEAWAWFAANGEGQTFGETEITTEAFEAAVIERVRSKQSEDVQEFDEATLRRFLTLRNAQYNGTSTHNFSGTSWVSLNIPTIE